MFARYIRKNRHYIALAKRAIVYCSLFRLKRSSYRVSECRVAWNISLRDQHARQSHTLVSPPTCSLFSEVLNFIFNPLSVVSRRDKWRIFFLWFYILAAPVGSRWVVKKRETERIDVAQFHSSPATYSWSTTMPRLLITEMILFPERKYRKRARNIIDTEQYCPMLLFLFLSYYFIKFEFYVHVIIMFYNVLIIIRLFCTKINFSKFVNIYLHNYYQYFINILNIY